MVKPMAGRASANTSTFRRLPHWLALFAVFVQLFASIGHIHPEDYRFLLHGHGTLSVKAGDGPSGGESSPVLPADRDCAICASAHLLGSSTLPDAVAPQAPRLENLALLTAVEELWLTPPPHLLFFTRGPPLL
jgi:hypothetical protein